MTQLPTSSRPPRRALLAAALLVPLLAAGPPAALADQVGYAYDAYGRLAAVTDGAGTTWAYSYDNAGNLLSIAPADLIVTELSPTSGQFGASVTLKGIGFGSGPNTVKFNGTTAVVNNATATQIVTSVPAGATSGPITVQNGLGTATSLIDFRVVGGPPTIVSVTPGKGVADAVIQVNGTNFEVDDPGGNALTLSGVLAEVTPSSDTALSFTVPPSVGSGRILLDTPNGSATAPADFLVAPPGFTAADVDSGVRVGFDPNGVSINAVIASGGKLKLVLFDAAAGDRISYTVTSPNPIVNTPPFTHYRLIRPDNTLRDDFYPSNGPQFHDTLALDQSGTWALAIDPDATLAGTWPVTLYKVTPDPVTPVAFVPAGTTVTPSNTVAGQNMRLTFSVTAGDRVSYEVVGPGVINSAPYTRYKLLAPDSSLFNQHYPFNGPSYRDTLTLSQGGTWTLLVDPDSTLVSNWSVTLYKVTPDPVTPVAFVPAGTTVTPSNTVAGQNMRLTFSVTAGDRVSYEVVGPGVVNSAPYTRYKLLAPDSSLFNEHYPFNGPSYRDTLTLSQGGTWTLMVDPDSTLVSNWSVTLYKVTPDPVTPVAFVPAGTTVTPSNTVPGQNMRVTFTAAAGDRVSYEVVSPGVVNNPPYTRYKLLRPSDASVANEFAPFNGPQFQDSIGLDQSGTWTLLVDPESTLVSNWSVTPYKANDVTAVAPTNGTAAPQLTTTVIGQDAAWTFSASIGKMLDFDGTYSGASTCVAWVVVRPSGDNLFASGCAGTSFSPSPLTLNETGTWSIRADEGGMQNHPFNLTVTVTP